MITRTPLAIAACAFVVMLAIAYGVFRAEPFCMDEYGYLYQAEIFAGGDTHLEQPPALEPLRELYVEAHDGKLFSKYPPGFSMVLAIGVELGVPFAINPLLGAITLLLLYVVVRRLAGERAAIAAQLILATNPFFVAYSASLFAHALTLALVMGVLVVLTDSKPRWLLLGTLLGALIWVRPVDAAACGMFVAFAVVRRDGWRRAFHGGSLALLPFAAFALAVMAYNARLSGRFALSTYPVTGGEFKLFAGAELSFADNFTAIADDYVRRLVHEGEVLWGRYFVWPAGVLVPLLALAAILLRAGDRGWRIALAFHFVAVVLLYNFHGMPSPVPTWPQYGARYWYSGFGAIVILAMLALVELQRRHEKLATPRHAAIGLGVILALQLAIGVSLFHGYAQRFELQAAISRDIERACPGKRLVILDIPVRSRLPVFVRPEDFKRNPFFAGERLFVIGTPEPSLVRALPGYTTCRYGFAPWAR